MNIKKYLLAFWLILLLSCDLTTEEKLRNATEDYLQKIHASHVTSFSINTISTLTEREVYLLEYRRQYDKLLEKIGNQVLSISKEVDKYGNVSDTVLKQSTYQLRSIHDSISDLSREFTNRFISLDNLKPKYYKVEGKFSTEQKGTEDFSFFFGEDFNKLDIHKFIEELESSKS